MAAAVNKAPLLLTLLLAAIVGAAVLPHAHAAPTTEPMSFGMDSYSLKAQAKEGVTPDYATFWVGPWTLESGWKNDEARLKAVLAADVTPAIHLYYWGDDISKKCIEKGCHSDLHGVRKDQKGWDKLTEQLLDKLEKHMDGEEVVIFLETEFNKGNVATYERLDGLLAAKADRIHQRHPEAHVVLALGTWGTEHWGTWDRAAAASDAVGVQAMRASTVDSKKGYMGAFDATLKAAHKAQETFGKPVFVQDVALSSYPDKTYAKHQATALSPFFDRMDELKAAGVEAVVYRSWRDAKNMDTKNYYGKAERSWGLAESDGDLKPAAKVWKKGVKAERADPATPARVWEVESFKTHSAGGVQKHKALSGGKEWNLWSDGHVATKMKLEPGTYELTVRAKGTTVDGVGPKMKVYVDGEKVLTAEPGRKYGDHKATVRVDGPSEVRITYGNDAAKGKEDRNLVLDRVSVTPA